MKIKKNKKIVAFLLLSLIILSMFFFITKNYVRSQFYYLIDYLETRLDNKASSIAELYNYNTLNEIDDTLFKINKKLINNFFKDVYPKLNNLNFENKFKSIDIEIKFSELKNLLQDRRSSIINSNIKVNSTWVKGTIVIDDKIYNAKFRLKGNLIDHWRSPIRMSLRVKLETGSFYNFTEFNIHKMEARIFPYDHIFAMLVEKSNLLGSNHKYANINFNGTNWGVMNIEDTKNKNYLELNKFPGDLVARFGNQENYLYERQIEIQPLNPLVDLSISDINFNKLGSPYYNNYIYYQIYNNKFEEIFDNEKMIRSILIALIWGNLHSVELTNLRFAFNKFTLKFEPILSDVGVKYKKIDDYDELFNNYLEHLKIFLNNNTDKKIIFKNLKIINNGLVSLSNELHKVNNLFKYNRNINIKILFQNLKTLENYFKINEIKNIKKIQNKKNYSQEIFTKVPYKLIPVLIMENGKYRIRLYNPLRNDILIEKIKLNDKSLQKNFIINGSYCSSSNECDYKKIIQRNFKEFFISDDIDLENLTIEYSIDKTDYVYQNVKFINLDISNFINDFENYKSYENYVLESGINYINKPIVVYGKLEILPGAILIFQKDTFIKVNGQLIANGTLEEPIILSTKSKNEFFNGIFVNGSGAYSNISNVFINNIKSFRNSIQELDGALIFYNTNISIKNLQIKNSSAEDAINLVNSKINLINLRIENTTSDCIDIDFSSGQIKNTFVSNCLGDGIDTSGSKLEIINTRANNIGDKSISIGENSLINLKNHSCNYVETCIAVKDGSTLNADLVNLGSKFNFGLMIFNKKRFYTSSKAIFKNLNINREVDNHTFLKERNSYLKVDNNLIKDSDFNFLDQY